VQPIDARRRDRAIVAQGGLGGAGTVIAARPKNGTAMPSFNFWSINSAKFCPCRSAAFRSARMPHAARCQIGAHRCLATLPHICPICPPTRRDG